MKRIKTGTVQSKAYSYSAHITQLYIFFMLIFPLYYNSSKYIAITQAKYSYYCIVTIVALALIFICYLLAWIRRKVQPWHLVEIWKRTSATKKLIFLFLLIGILSSALSPYQEVVWKGDARYGGMLTILLYGCSFYMTALWGCWKKAFSWIVFAVTIAFSAIGILQYYGIDVLQLYPHGGNFAVLHFISTCGNMDFACTYLCMAVPIMVVYFIVDEKANRFFYLIPVTGGMLLLALIGVEMGSVAMIVTFGCMLPLLIETKQRLLNTSVAVMLCYVASLVGKFMLTDNDIHIVANATALCVIIILFVLVKSINDKWFSNTKRLRWIGVSIFIVQILVLIGALFMTTNNRTEGLLYELRLFVLGQAPDYFGHGRVGIWRRSIEMGLLHPLLGSGADSFAAEFYNIYAQFSVETAGVAVYDAAHNEFIHYFCTFGILGLLAYSGWLLALLVRGYRAAIKGSKECVLLLAGIIGYTVQSIFNLSVVIIAPYFFVLCGIIEMEITKIRLGSIAIVKKCDTKSKKDRLER